MTNESKKRGYKLVSENFLRRIEWSEEGDDLLVPGVTIMGGWGIKIGFLAEILWRYEPYPGKSLAWAFLRSLLPW